MNKNVIQFPKTKQQAYVTRSKAGSHVLNMASGLMMKLRINPDRSLVSVIGKGNEKSNHEAIVTWLLSNYSPEEINSMASQIDSIAKALHNHLSDYMEDVSC